MDELEDVLDMEHEEREISLRTALLRRQKIQQEALATRQKTFEEAKTAMQRAEAELRAEEQRTKDVMNDVRQQRRRSDYHTRRATGFITPLSQSFASGTPLRLRTQTDSSVQDESATSPALGGSTSAVNQPGYLPSSNIMPNCPTNSTSAPSAPTHMAISRISHSIGRNTIIEGSPKKFDRLEKASSIIYTGSQWVEIRCYVCHGNQTSTTGLIVQGIKGMATHFQKSHPAIHVGPLGKFLELCTTRTVPASEISRIRSWDLRQPPIELQRFAFPEQNLQFGSDSSDHSDSTRLSSDPNRKTSRRSTSDNSLPSNIQMNPNGSYVELRCPECGRNARKAVPNTFFDGLRGFNKHFDAAHLNLGHRKHQGFEFFTYRTFTPLEVELMRNLEPGAPRIERIFSATGPLFPDQVVQPAYLRTSSSHPTLEERLNGLGRSCLKRRRSTFQDENGESKSLSHSGHNLRGHELAVTGENDKDYRETDSTHSGIEVKSDLNELSASSFAKHAQ